jgi:CDP-diacylglycerol--glycerol-3-phosphate 3-phosphatidyltransferase
MTLTKQQIPWAMAALRVALGPVLILGARANWNGATLAGIVVTALLSDIFDGILARRWLCDTPAVRLFDSMADTAFYLCVAIAMWAAFPAVWHANLPLLLALLGLECSRFAVDFARFGKPASYHSYLAKSWGLVMAVGVTALFALHRSNPLISLALIMGIACDLEGLAISFILPAWRRDIKTVAAAWRMRRDLLATR